MFENKKEPLATRSQFLYRNLISLLWATFILFICLSLGILGYHYIANIEWVDAIHNASMILSGMGPVVEIKNVSGKLFSSGYALFSGVAFITNIGFLLAPAVHRFFHILHLEEDDK